MVLCAEVMPEAAPYEGGDGRTGVVFCHGFTGTPESMRDWAIALQRSDVPGGVAVFVPRLPGHGTSARELAATTWQDWYFAVERAMARAAESCDRVFVAGLSMGGALALLLAADHPVAGVLLVNPSIGAYSPSIRLAACSPLGSAKAVASDIAAPTTRETSYDRVPFRAVRQLTLLWDQVEQRLDSVRAPILLMRSSVDHVVDDYSSDRLRARDPAPRFVELANSYHVATMDYDMELVWEASIQFVAELVGAEHGR